MSNVNALINERLKKGDRSSKISELAKQTAEGNLTSFTGIFSISDLTDEETHVLEELLANHSDGKQNLKEDLKKLVTLTCEVKAINNQAALLHGERIKKAHAILTRYRDGAFTSWLTTAYGNRQTPYNFLQYYEFCEAMPKLLRAQIEAMPRQAVYSLASREGPIEKKQALVAKYQGQTKDELLQMIRETFPLALQDRRKENPGEKSILIIQRAIAVMAKARGKLSKSQKESLYELLNTLEDLIRNA